ncbi:hypothetical protein Q8F55_005277 [Vanrija albida]|uniref:Uncharacterized protein n=1 Tax=Vanrija albida TaxID=181172 RepID=A0ABR3Q159_9TREE
MTTELTERTAEEHGYERAPDPATTIAVLHEAGVDAYAFLTRLIGPHGREDGDAVPWRIDNKYYTADVEFAVYALPGGVPPAAVLLYLFEGGAPDPLPAALARAVLADPPPDIALAVRVVQGDGEGEGKEEEGEADPRPLAPWDPVGDEERFDELGIEVVDEGGVADLDDERPLDPLETVRQTLMTHMWPNMERKAGRRTLPRPEVEDDGSDEEGNAGPRFPVGFGAVDAPRAAGPASDFPALPAAERNGHGGDEADYAQMLDGDEDDDFGGFASAPGPSAAEYARLDAWLDDDGELPPPTAEDVALAELAELAAHPGAARLHGFRAPESDDEGDGFDDNFTARAAAPALPLDPTPILLHLQQVRAELSQVADEDERRDRAGREVTRLMQSLGLGGGAFDLDDDDEEDLAEIGAIRP